MLDSFTINGVRWQVYLVGPTHPALQRLDGAFTIGSCDNLAQAIFIRYDLPPQLARKVLCHEVTHAAMFSYDIILSVDQEELLADLIATYGDEIITIADQLFARLKRR